MDRLEVLRGMFDTKGVGLEIGPSYNPVVPKRDGYDVEILDYADADRLREIHRNAEIEPVDYISGGSSIADAIPHRARYDYIVASHVIEHQPDIIGFLNDCAALLKPSGRLVLAVPDKRHCFDVFMPLSTAGQALQAHLERRIRHPVSMIFDHHAYAAARAGNIVWNAGYFYGAAFVHNLATARKFYASAVGSDAYVDVHSWFFSPSSFRLLIRDLHEIHAVVLNEVTFVPGSGPEFYMALSLSGAGCPTGRIELKREIMAELRSVPD